MDRMLLICAWIVERLHIWFWVAVVALILYWMHRMAMWDLEEIYGNLDPQVARGDDLPVPKESRPFIRFEDIDRDGDYDSLLIWDLGSRSEVDILVRKNTAGNLLYPTLAPGAVPPHLALSKGIPLRYVQDSYGDRDYDSMWSWDNGSETIDIPVEIDAAGNLIYPTLATSAVAPHEALSQGAPLSYLEYEGKVYSRGR